MTNYSKAIAALLTQGLTFAAMYYGTNHYVAMAIGILGALGVYAVPNSVPGSADHAMINTLSDDADKMRADIAAIKLRLAQPTVVRVPAQTPATAPVLPSQQVTAPAQPPFPH